MDCQSMLVVYPLQKLSNPPARDTISPQTPISHEAGPTTQIS